jgi:hypothetical protein
MKIEQSSSRVGKSSTAATASVVVAGKPASDELGELRKSVTQRLDELLNRMTKQEEAAKRDAAERVAAKTTFNRAANNNNGRVVNYNNNGGQQQRRGRFRGRGNQKK